MFTSFLQRRLRSAPVRRSTLLKAAGYRILSVIVTVAVAFVVLRDASAALDVGIWANVLKTGVYYAYERAWSGVRSPASIRTSSQFSDGGSGQL